MPSDSQLLPVTTTTVPGPAVDGPARAARLASVAAAVPEQVVLNADVAGRLGVSDDWIVTRTGVRERRIAREDERLVDLAAAAGRAALDRAGVDPASLGLVVVATMAADELTPNA